MHYILLKTKQYHDQHCYFLFLEKRKASGMGACVQRKFKANPMAPPVLPGQLLPLCKVLCQLIGSIQLKTAAPFILRVVDVYYHKK